MYKEEGYKIFLYIPNGTKPFNPGVSKKGFIRNSTRIKLNTKTFPVFSFSSAKFFPVLNRGWRLDPTLTNSILKVAPHLQRLGIPGLILLAAAFDMLSLSTLRLRPTLTCERISNWSVNFRENFQIFSFLKKINLKFRLRVNSDVWKSSDVKTFEGKESPCNFTLKALSSAFC